MTKDEMQRLLDEFAEDGFGEYEALRKFIRILGIRYPVEKIPENKEEKRNPPK